MKSVELEYLLGLINGLQAAVRGLIAAHPEPELAILNVGLCIEDMQASGLASTATSAEQLLGLERSPDLVIPTQVQLDRARLR